MATDQDNFADRLIRSRSQHGWSQLDLSKASGVAAAQISRYEQGNNTPRPQVVAKLAAALKVSFDWLLTGTAKDAAEAPPDMRAYMLSIPGDLLARVFIAAAETHRSIDQEIIARLESSFVQSTIDRDVALAASAAGAVMEGLERVNENVALFAKRMERIEAKIGIAGGAEPLKLGTPAVVLNPDGVETPPTSQVSKSMAHYAELVRPMPEPAPPKPPANKGPEPSPNARRVVNRRRT